MSTAKSTYDVHVGIPTKPQRKVVLMNPSFSYSEFISYLGKTWHWDAMWEESKPAGAMLWTVFCWRTVIQVHLFMETIP